jgi:hypothetical protein
MKKIILMLAIISLAACHNQEQDFPDYAYTTGYFPYQYPVRTLLLGNDILYDNSNDNAHKFIISAAMGGVYKNSKNRSFSFRIDESLCNNAVFRASGKPVRPLPANYYTLSSSDRIVIEAGNFSGGITVQLTDAFFNDPEAINVTYVVPLKITAADGIDSVLVGSPSVPDPDPRVAGDWSIVPKDFTMFAVKFRNPYDGTFLHRGRAVFSGSISQTVAYRSQYVENDELRTVATTGKNQVSLTAPARIPGKSGTVNLNLNFPDGSTGDGDCTITGTVAYDAQTYPVTGSGQFRQGKEAWGGKQRDVLYINYNSTDPVNNINISANDTLVLRDRNMAIETYEILVQ